MALNLWQADKICPTGLSFDVGTGYHPWNDISIDWEFVMASLTERFAPIDAEALHQKAEDLTARFDDRVDADTGKQASTSRAGDPGTADRADILVY